MILLAILTQLSAEAADCSDPQTQSDINICAGRDFAEADEALNAQWRITADDMRERDAWLEARPDNRPGYFETLLKGQRAWLAFRDAHCESEGYYARGGSMESMLVSHCRATLTRERTAQLRELADRPG